MKFIEKVAITKFQFDTTWLRFLWYILVSREES